MAEDPKKSDNKLYQLIVLLITTIVAPVTVYFATHAIDAKNAAQAATQPPTVVLANEAVPTMVPPTQTSETGNTTPEVSLTETVQASPTAALTETMAASEATATTFAPTATFTSTTAPSPTTPPSQAEVASAGTAATTAEGFTLSIEEDGVRFEDNAIFLTIKVQNLSNQAQTFTYTAQSITVKDNTGHVFQPAFSEKKEACNKPDLSEAKKVQVNPNQTVTIKSVSSKEPQKWCGRDANELIPLYDGSPSRNAKTLLITFDEFGPFKGVTVEYNLK